MTGKAHEVIDETIERLARINLDTAECFSSTMAVIELPPGSAVFFAEACLAIADAGWRSFESVDLLLEIALFDQPPTRLIEIAKTAMQLSGYSFEPASTYLNLVLESLGNEASADISELEQTGLELHSRYQHASGLIGSYFRAAKSVLNGTDSDNLNDWAALSRDLFDLHRDDLARFFKLSEGSTREISWPVIRKLQLRSATGALVYLNHHEKLRASFTAEQLRVLELTVMKHAENGLEDFFESLEELRGHNTDQLSLILELGESIEHVNSVAAFYRCVVDLPLHRQTVIRKWVDDGNDVARTNELAGLAYFKMESARSNDVLKALQGEVAFEDHRRTFDLLAEAVTTRQFVVETFDNSIAVSVESNSMDPSGFRERQASSVLSDSDGRVVRLPKFVSLFDSEVDNFGFYKVSLFHQLGYAEFGCFEQIQEVSDTLGRYASRPLAERLFLIIEDARIDWQMANRYAGMKHQLARQKLRASQARPVRERTRQGQLLEVLVQSSLDAPYEKHVREHYWPEAALLWQLVGTLKVPGAGVGDSLDVLARCYGIIETPEDDALSDIGVGAFGTEPELLPEELPEPVAYRGQVDVEQVKATLKIEALVEELGQQLEALPDEPPGAQMPGADQDQIEPGDLKKGDVGEGVAMLLTELENELGSEPGEVDPGDKEGLFEFLGGISQRSKDATEHQYDEWDYQISDYRPRWCTLFEHRDLEVDEQYVHNVLRDHQELARKIRQQLNKVKPEMLRKVKGVVEGEELDLERTIAYVVDRKAGLTPDDTIYVQRQRKERDVSTLFLLDMSASTDDIIPDPDAEPIEPLDIDDDEYLIDFFRKKKELDDEARRIIDIEKESVVLMADALENLGDAYSVCGFSGYGKDQVDYYLCKDFNEPFDARSRGRIGGIKPCRSTRMGPPIRHATRSLLETGSRIKALIIMSDGYPQDHDYGTDRNSKDYGLMDTMKALSEAKQQGVLTYCLTVDPSGHDYLRAMCPDSQYMIIQDLDQLPEELSRVYRSLTG